ncbi:MAG: hypothetical protein ABIL16_07890 [candidate division WOR-3 bacterium]
MEKRQNNEERRVPRLSERKPYEKPAIIGRSMSKGGNILITS